MIRLLRYALFSSLTVSACGALDATHATELLEKVPGSEAALNAHTAGLCDVAVRRLDVLGAHPDLDPATAAAISHLKAENLVRCGRYREALDLLPADGSEDPDFWRGVALIGLGQIDEAALLLEPIAADADHPFRVSAGLTLVSALTATGSGRSALGLLKRISDPENPADFPFGLAAAELQNAQGAYAAAAASIDNLAGLKPEHTNIARILYAQSLIGSGDAEAGREILGAMLTDFSRPLPSALHARAALALAGALETLGENSEARALMRSLAERTADGDTVLLALDRLDRGGEFSSEEAQRQLRIWAEGTNRPLAEAARLFLARAQLEAGATRDALQSLNALAEGDSAVALRAKLQLIRHHLATKENGGTGAEIERLMAGEQSPKTRARIQFINAQAQYERGEFVQAAENFESAAAGDAASDDQAIFNAALSALKAGDDEAFRAQLAMLPEVHGEKVRADLMLERALLLTAKGDESAPAELEKLVAEHPGHPRIAEIYLAHAGLHLLAWPARSKSARDALAAARERPLDDKTREEADYLAFWIEEDSTETEAAVAAAEHFLKTWPGSPRAPEIRMRQAEVHFRNGDYLDARLAFESLHADYPDSDLADKALFFAGRAAMLTNTEDGAQKALELWQRLAVENSPLALHARRHQAQIRLRQGKEKEAISLLQSVLDASPAPSDELRISCLLLKGEALFREGGSDEEALAKAIATFREARSIEGVSVAAFNEALFREGKAHESLGDQTSALDCFHTVISAPRRPLEDGEAPEYRWFYRAGFECIALLQAKGTPQSIDAAINIADTLTQTSGPRAEEARKTAQQLRLENFRWR